MKDFKNSLRLRNDFSTHQKLLRLNEYYLICAKIYYTDRKTLKLISKLNQTMKRIIYVYILGIFTRELYFLNMDIIVLFQYWYTSKQLFNTVRHP